MFSQPCTLGNFRQPWGISKQCGLFKNCDTVRNHLASWLPALKQYPPEDQAIQGITIVFRSFWECSSDPEADNPAGYSLLTYWFDMQLLFFPLSGRQLTWWLLVTAHFWGVFVLSAALSLSLKLVLPQEQIGSHVAALLWFNRCTARANLID